MERREGLDKEKSKSVMNTEAATEGLKGHCQKLKGHCHRKANNHCHFTHLHTVDAIIESYVFHALMWSVGWEER